jgi:glycerate kinase
VDVEAMPGAGAAGGLGGGLAAFLGVKLRPGAALVLDALRFHDRLAGCDACLTAEGRLDEQTLRGKAVSGVAQAAAARGVPVFAFVGSVQGDAHELAKRAGLAEVVEIGRGLPREQSIRGAAELMEEAVARWAARQSKAKPGGQ